MSKKKVSIIRNQSRKRIGIAKAKAKKAAPRKGPAAKKRSKY